MPALNGGNRNTSGQLSQQANSKTASKVAQRHCILPKYNLPQKFTEQAALFQNEWLFFQDNFNGLTFLVDIEVVTKREKEDGAIQLGPKVNLRLPLPVSSATDT